MFRTLILPSLLPVFLMGSASVFADDAKMPALLFTNTLRIENRFAVNDIFVDPDHTWTSVGATVRARTRGTWEFIDGALCVTQTDPPQPSSPPKSFCEPLAGRKLGDVWEKTDARNGVVRSSLIPRREAR